MAFTGFPAGGLTFYERLGADNSKAFWQANKATFESDVQAPMRELCAELDDFGPFHLFRPYNDVRFAKNRPPYKVHQGAYGEREGGAGYYVHLGAEGLYCGAGYYSMAKDQLERFRAAVDDDTTGVQLERICAALTKRGFGIGAMSELKTAPRGYSKDHPRIELIRRGGLVGSKDFGAPAWLHTRQVVKKVRDAWNTMGPMCDWLDRQVGPSTAPPPDAM